MRGRSPRRNRDGGRDHYPNLTTLAFAGGGLKMGQVIGQSDRLAAQPSSERYTPKHLRDAVWLAAAPPPVQALWRQVLALAGQEPTALEQAALAVGGNDSA